MFIDWKLSRNEKVYVGEYALKKKESYWLTQLIIAHGSGSAGCWKTRAREKNSRRRSRTTVFTLTDYRAIQQTRPRIAKCKPSFTCRRCHTKTQTDKYTYIDCSNSDCNSKICLLDNGFKNILPQSPESLVSHQYATHLINANPHQCYLCKTPKHQRYPDTETALCTVCGVNWCLVGNC